MPAASGRDRQGFGQTNPLQAHPLGGGWIIAFDVARDLARMVQRRAREHHPVVHWRRFLQTSSTGTPPSSASERSASSMAASIAGVSVHSLDPSYAATSCCAPKGSFSKAASISASVLTVTTLWCFVGWQMRRWSTQPRLAGKRRPDDPSPASGGPTIHRPQAGSYLSEKNQAITRRAW